MKKFTIQRWQLKQRQSLPLNAKIKLSLSRIRNWYEYCKGNVYIAFSGGKDSTVLLHLVRSLYPNTPAVFSDTGLEYPEIREFVKTIPNVIWIKPEMNFKAVIEKYGYPIINKRVSYLLEIVRNPTDNNQNSRTLCLTGINSSGKFNRSYKIPDKWMFLIDAPFKISSKCCDIMKKRPMNKFTRKNKIYPYIGSMACESYSRIYDYMRSGCNSFTKKTKRSTPLAFWNDQDIWDYIKTNNLPYCDIYNLGYSRTGCMFCMFGLHLDLYNRFDLMRITHLAQYKYCMDKLGLRDVIAYIANGISNPIN